MKIINRLVEIKVLTVCSYFAICLFFGRAIWGNVELLYLGMLFGLSVFLGQMLYKRHLPRLAIGFVVIVVMSYVVTLANNSLDQGALFIPLTLAHVGIAWRISTHGINYNFAKFVFFGSLLFFLYSLLVLDVNASSIFANSRNYVSVYFLNAVSIVFISIYLSRSFYLERIKVITSAIGVFLASLFAIGSMGIFSSFLLVILSAFGFMKKNHVIIFCFLFVLAIFYFQDWDGFLGFLSQFQIISRDKELLAKLGYLQLTQENPRYSIWSEYINRLDTMRVFFGINLSERFYGFSNYHNSFVLLHARTGFYMYIITLMFLYSTIRAFKVNYFLASCLLVLLFRSLTDTSILAGSPFDFVLFFLLFFLGGRKNQFI